MQAKLRAYMQPFYMQLHGEKTNPIEAVIVIVMMVVVMVIVMMMIVVVMVTSAACAG